MTGQAEPDELLRFAALPAAAMQTVYVDRTTPADARHMGPRRFHREYTRREAPCPLGHQHNRVTFEGVSGPGVWLMACTSGDGAGHYFAARDPDHPGNKLAAAS